MWSLTVISSYLLEISVQSEIQDYSDGIEGGIQFVLLRISEIQNHILNDVGIGVDHAPAQKPLFPRTNYIYFATLLADAAMFNLFV